MSQTMQEIDNNSSRDSEEDKTQQKSRRPPSKSRHRQPAEEQGLNRG